MKKETTAGKKEGNKKNDPITRKEEVEHSKDERIDQDFPGFPHAPATEDTIKHKKDLPTKVQEG